MVNAGQTSLQITWYEASDRAPKRYNLSSWISHQNTMVPSRSALLALLDANANWVDAVNQAEPGFFAKSAQGQRPKVLWFGCADSRVPESVITAARPGDIFVHRNIANQFHPDDDSANAVLAFAVGPAVGVEHVVVAGHTHCGGAAAAHQAALAGSKPAATPLSRWLTPLTNLAASLNLSNTPLSTALDLIVRENVKRQVEHICDAEPVKRAWAAGKPLWVHGWVYDVASGRIKDLGVSRGPDVPSA